MPQPPEVGGFENSFMKWFSRNRLKSRVSAMLGLAVFIVSGWGQANAQPPVAPASPSPTTAPPPLQVEQYQLANGLTVILDHQPRLPVVAVEVRYLVGSAHERPGRSGFAHLFEHLMFQGSQHHDREYFAPFEPIGAAVNGTTNQDRTNYYERVPSNHLELALWMESDRMGNLLPVLTQAKLDNQRDVVKNERRQRYENQPYGLAWLRLTETLFPTEHPYHRSVIGSHEDLSAASLDDVRQFFQEHYGAANAVLTISGSFGAIETRQLVERYFGNIPAGQRTATPQVSQPSLERIEHVVLPDQVKLPRVYLAWHTPALFAQGDAELDLFAAALSHGKTSRLYKPLIYDKKLAQSVDAFQVSLGLSGFFVVQATAAPGVDAETLARALVEELKAATHAPLSGAEFERSLNRYTKGFYSRLESVLERARLLSTYYHFTGKADYVQQDLQRYLTASPEGVQQAAQRWLTLDRYARIDIVPPGTDP